MKLSLCLPFLIAALVATACSKNPSSAAPSTLNEAVAIEEVDSQYTRISVRQFGPLLGLYFHHQGKAALQAAMRLDNPVELPIAYERYMTVGMAYLPEPPKRVLAVGLGAGSSARYLLHFLPNVRMDVAEVDGEVIRLAKEHFHLPTDPRLNVVNEDGRVFLNRAPDGEYDLILLDAFSHSFAPFHLTTQEFLQLVKRKLAPGGVVAQNIAPTMMLFGSSVATAETVFDHIDAYEASGNVVLIGYNGPKITDEALVTSAMELQKRIDVPYGFKILVATRGSVLDEAKGKVLTDNYSPSEILAAQPSIARGVVR